ncbi:hypothetical protein [Xanthomonas hortorum]|uniref:hypothetical protein n=1 Tax=Xanthomonas hortorum TaxID=56454 RepID=UPI001F43349C|nr:hypothetical protein [Xanthomonas hortorum]MCE4297237.1 hypothetical protein [Xanthomonas hortorum pv. vitians]MCE4366215.1 hypothetical protein [Xanthomonas hortorum pv. vitians]
MDTIRTCRSRDFAARMVVFDGNVPAFFCAEERPDFVRFLAHYAAAWHYHVIEGAGEVVACAGYSISTGGMLRELLSFTSIQTAIIWKR